jgi:hypothetical protein
MEVEDKGWSLDANPMVEKIDCWQKKILERGVGHLFSKKNDWLMKHVSRVVDVLYLSL